MKLRNLMYATMIACAFASCSKDDDPVVNPDGGDPEATATLDVKIATKDVATKTAMPTNDKEIKSLKLVVFTPDNSNAYTVEAVGVVDGKGDQEKSVKTPVKPGVKKVIVLANYSGTITPGVAMSTIVGANGLSQDFTEENTTNGFSMNSKIYDITVKESKTNYLGYGTGAENDKEIYLTQAGANPVQMYRNVAKVALKKLTFAVKSTNQYPGATLTPLRVFVLHAKTNTYLAPDATHNWAPTEKGTDVLIGSSVGEYADPWVLYMKTPNADKSEKEAVYNYIDASVNGAPKYTNEPAYTYSATAAGKLTQSGTYTPTATPFYVYENTANEDGYQTLLVVEATFSFNDPNNNNQAIAETRYYPVAVGKDADFTNLSTTDFNFTETGREKAGVLRNLSYEITMTASGPGYKTPFGPKPDGEEGEGGDTFLDAQVKVVDFGTVTQEDDVE